MFLGQQINMHSLLFFYYNFNWQQLYFFIAQICKFFFFFPFINVLKFLLSKYAQWVRMRNNSSLISYRCNCDCFNLLPLGDFSIFPIQIHNTHSINFFFIFSSFSSYCVCSVSLFFFFSLLFLVTHFLFYFKIIQLLHLLIVKKKK